MGGRVAASNLKCSRGCVRTSRPPWRDLLLADTIILINGRIRKGYNFKKSNAAGGAVVGASLRPPRVPRGPPRWGQPARAPGGAPNRPF